MASALIAPLESLCKRAETICDRFQAVHPTRSQLEVLLPLASRLTQAASDISEMIRSSRESWPTDDAIKLLGQVRGCETEGEPSATILKRNMTLIFEGPKDSALDSSQVSARKKVLRKRCSTICGLYPEIILRWATKFPPSVWVPGAMSQDTFDYVVEEMKSDIESEEVYPIPSKLPSILLALGTEAPLNRNANYQHFVQAIDERMALPSDQRRPRKRMRALTQSMTGRKIQYMFSKAPIDRIPLLAELLPKAIHTSNQWEMERLAGEPTTECLSTLVPEGENEDVSITLWASQREGARVINMFKLQQTWSALGSHQPLEPHA